MLIVLGVQSNKDWSLFSAMFYGLSLLLLYTFSSIYHGLTHKKAKYVFNILDHCAIYLLIAGTYTPVLLLIIGGFTGWLFFSIQWGMALIGIMFKIFSKWPKLYPSMHILQIVLLEVEKDTTRSFTSCELED